MIIVEGPDFVGKTTLCRKLTGILGGHGVPAVYQHFTRLPSCWDYYWDYLPYIQRTTVMDRFHLSEWAYAHARGEVSPLTPEKMALLGARLTDAGAVVVVVTATEDRLKHEHAVQGDDEMYRLETILRANTWYRSHVTGRRPMHDLHYELTAGCPYPSGCDAFVDDICALWRARQDFLVGIKLRGRNNPWIG